MLVIEIDGGSIANRLHDTTILFLLHIHILVCPTEVIYIYIYKFMHKYIFPYIFDM